MPSRASSRKSSIVAMKRLSALIAAAPRPGMCSASAATSQTDSPTRAEWATIRDSDVCPSPRRGELATRLKLTTSNGLASHEVGDRVLDLRALVELGAADHLVGDLTAHQRVLDHARHRVRAVEDRDLRARSALVDEPLHLADDETRLGVLVVEPVHLDWVPPPWRSTAAWRSRRGCWRSPHWRPRGSSASSGSSAPA